ncbi:MAG: 4Fe-4S dicluster domain-containing protein [Ignavibacteriae bacterium]|nr:MAG: 4Fe-4S dicluster domain-containing protein [Ignavibacteriota bacterium]
MILKTSRTAEYAEITVDYEKCNMCKLCLKVCKSSLYEENGKILVDQSKMFGCIGCGQCEAVCPLECIFVNGRTLSQDDFIPLPAKEQRANMEQLYSLLLSRRSTREFKNREVEQEVIDEILKAASTAPMGIPPSDVCVLVVKGKDKVREFAFDFVDTLQKMKWMFSSFMLKLWRLFMSKEEHEMMKNFIVPLMDFFPEKKEIGEDWVLYDAPLVMYFYGTLYADPVDPVIPATYAMITAQSLGLGTCMIGTIGPFIKKGANKFKEKYGIPQKHVPGVAVIFGYPVYKYKKAIKRTFANVKYY